MNAPIVNLYDLSLFDRDILLSKIDENGYCVVRGLFQPPVIRSSLRLLQSKLSQSPHIFPTRCSPEVVRANSIKWSIGSTSSVQGGISRFMLTIMNPLRNEDLFNLHSTYKTLIHLRDLIANREIPLFDDQLPEPFFNGTRIQHYPSGGGFMTAHSDTTGADTAQHLGGDYIQLVLLLSQKGIDFQEGGAFVFKDDKYVDVEVNTQSGDVLVYNSSIVHGVSDIDPQVPLDLSTANGRFAALATIYK